MILKATKVDGVYSGDPVQGPDATFFPSISYLDILNRGLKVMDSTAISLCMDNRLPLVVFNVGATRATCCRVVQGETVGTRVGETLTMTNKILADAEERMKKALEATRRELSGIRTGKATPGAARHGAGRGLRPDGAAQAGRARSAPPSRACSSSSRGTRA